MSTAVHEYKHITLKSTTTNIFAYCFQVMRSRRTELSACLKSSKPSTWFRLFLHTFLICLIQSISLSLTRRRRIHLSTARAFSSCCLCGRHSQFRCFLLKKSTIVSMRPSTLFRYEHFSARGRAPGASRPSINFGPPHISETTRARKLKFYTHLDTAKYSFRAWKFFHQGRAKGAAPPV